MTTRDRQLAETFRRARWPATHGRPVCPTCFDGEDVKPDPKTRRQHRPEVGTYYCGCGTRFTDCSGTALVHSKSPLRIWALALFTRRVERTEYGPRGYRPMDVGVPRATFTRMQQIWREHPELADRWQAELMSAGITFTILAAQKKVPA